MVGATGFEPATSCSQNTRATNCATPRSERKRYLIRTILCELQLIHRQGRDNQRLVDYQKAQEYIASLAQRGWRLGLDRMSEFANRADLSGSLGDGDSPKFIHVAGTNGKGSVTAMIQSCLAEQGFRTGAFFSPFVVDTRERIQFDRDMITETDLAKIATKLMPIGESLSDTDFGGVTEFEFKAAMGFEYWKQKKCEWVSLEVGLGGRLDATNIVSPAASAIVSISYDHTSILGSTLKEIAHEKAGIIKPGKPVVVGQMPPEALKEIERVASELSSPIWRIGKEIQWEKIRIGVNIATPYTTITVEPSLFGDIQLHNAAVAFSVMQLAGALKKNDKVREGFSRAYLPGRFQMVAHGGHTYLLDGAHNPDSANVLAKLLQQAGIKPRICITGMLNGHSAQEFYGQIRDMVEEFYVAPIDFHRSMNPTDLSQDLKSMGISVTSFGSVRSALEAAQEAKQTEPILVCGSFYLVGEVMRLLRSK